VAIEGCSTSHVDGMLKQRKCDDVKQNEITVDDELSGDVMCFGVCFTTVRFILPPPSLGLISPRKCCTTHRRSVPSLVALQLATSRPVPGSSCYMFHDGSIYLTASCFRVNQSKKVLHDPQTQCAIPSSTAARNITPSSGQFLLPLVALDLKPFKLKQTSVSPLVLCTVGLGSMVCRPLMEIYQ